MKVSEEYKSLYHYTTYEGLRGIFSSQTLWATHYRYLNDDQELIHAKEILNSILIPKILEIVKKSTAQKQSLQEIVDSHGGAENFSLRQSNSFIDILYGTILENKKGSDASLQGPFIVAFCASGDDPFVEANGLLSQWRAYGKDGGYAMEFDAKGLEELNAAENNEFYYPVTLLADVGYGKNLSNVPVDFKSDVGNLEKSLFPFFLDAGAGRSSDHFENSLLPFLKLISRSKHHGFREEKEVRAVFFSGTESLIRNEEKKEVKIRKIKPIKFRSKGGTPQPYIEVFTGVGTLPIKRIIVGPHKDKILRQKALELMLKGTAIKVVSSDIPFSGG